MPKLRLARLTVNVGVVAAVPVPVSATAAVGLIEELLVTVSSPVSAPEVLGLNCTLRVTDCFGFSVTGKLAPETVKPVPLIAAAVTFRAAVPVDVKVTD